jgi:hypothetical protein
MGEYRDPKSVNYTLLPSNRHVLGKQTNGATKEVTLGLWSGDLRLDIRKWQDGSLGKGISLTEDEVRALRRALDQISFGR